MSSVCVLGGFIPLEALTCVFDLIIHVCLSARLSFTLCSAVMLKTCEVVPELVEGQR